MRCSFLSLRGIAGALTLLAPFAAHAASTPTLDQITAADYDAIVKELSANFAYSSLTPASSLGGLWGFELGVIGGVTKTPEILNLVKRNDPTFKENKFPHAGLVGRLGLPMGFTVEAVALPKITASDMKLSEIGGAVEWTPNDTVWTALPVNVAVKGYINKTSMSYKQKIQNSSTGNVPVDATIDFDDKILGLQAIVSKRLSVFEPYVGIGYAKATGDLTVSASGYPAPTIFAFSSSSATSKPSSAQLLAGLDVRLAIVALGAEYQRSFGTNSFSGRLSFRF